MRYLYTITILFFILSISGCIKFDDPVLSPFEEQISCDNILVDDHCKVFNNGSFDESFNISPNNCNTTILSHNTAQSTFWVMFNTVISETTTLNITTSLIPQTGEVRLEYQRPLTFNSNVAQEGIMYVTIDNNGDTIYEWCDIPCGTTGNITISGRMVCD